MNSIVAVKTESGQTSFVLSNPFNLELLDHLSTLTGVQQSSRLVITDPKVVADILNPNQAQAAVTSDPLAAAQQKFKKKEDVQSTVLSADASASEESEPIIRLVNQFIENAYTSGSSDIHIEPWENEVVVRYRIDGDLRVSK